MVGSGGIFVGDLPLERAAATRCGGVVTAGAEHHRAQGLLVKPVTGSATEAELASAGIKEGRDAIDGLGQGEAVPSHKACRDRDSGSRGLAAVLIREGELVVEHQGAGIFQVAGG